MSLSETMRQRLQDGADLALILIDIQNDYCHPDGAFSKAGFDVTEMVAMTDRLVPVVRRCREQGVPVIHIQQTTSRDGYSVSPAWRHFVSKRMQDAGKEFEDAPVTVLEDSWGHATVDRLAPAEGERVIRKTRSSAFFQTDLDFVLRSRGIETLVFAGVMADGCVDSTVRSAVHRDYFVCLIEDGVEGYDPVVFDASLTIARHRYDTIEAWEMSEIVGGRSVAWSAAADATT